MDWEEVSKEEFDKFIQKLLHHPEYKEKMRQTMEWEDSKRNITWDSVSIAECWNPCNDHNEGHKYYQICMNTKGE